MSKPTYVSLLPTLKGTGRNRRSRDLGRTGLPARLWEIFSNCQRPPLPPQVPPLSPHPVGMKRCLFLHHSIIQDVVYLLPPFPTKISRVKVDDVVHQSDIGTIFWSMNAWKLEKGANLSIFAAQWGLRSTVNTYFVLQSRNIHHCELTSMWIRQQVGFIQRIWARKFFHQIGSSSSLSTDHKRMWPR